MINNATKKRINNNSRIKAYNYLLKMVNKQISLYLETIYYNQEAIKSNSELDRDNFNWYKNQLSKNKMKLKELKTIKRFLIEEKKWEILIEENKFCLMGQKGVKLYYENYFKNSKN